MNLKSGRLNFEPSVFISKQNMFHDWIPIENKLNIKTRLPHKMYVFYV